VHWAIVTGTTGCRNSAPPDALAKADSSLFSAKVQFEKKAMLPMALTAPPCAAFCTAMKLRVNAECRANTVDVLSA